jgi:hypothetical protein
MNPVTPHSSGEFCSNASANRVEVTSFNSIVLASLAFTVFWPVRCHPNSLFLSVLTEKFLYALPWNRRFSMQLIAYSVIFVAVETCSNKPLPSNEFKCHNTPQNNNVQVNNRH